MLKIPMLITIMILTSIAFSIANGGRFSSLFWTSNQNINIVEAEERMDQPSQQQEIKQHYFTTKLGCDEINSLTWWRNNATRISNVQDGMTEAFVDQLMDPNHLKHVDFLTSQTLALEGSTFRDQQWTNNGTSTTTTTIDSSILNAWEYKLTYLAIHAIFHEPAQDEYLVRKTQKQQQQQQQCSKQQQSRLPLYEYECSGAKYLVARFPGLGLGASLRTAMIRLLVSSILTKRIPVMLGTNIPRLQAEPYKLPPHQFSCLARKDYQCLFLPLSPCTPTLAEIQNASALDGEALRMFSLQSTTSKTTQAQHNNATISSSPKVLHVTPLNYPHNMGQDMATYNRLKRRIFLKAKSLIDTWSSQQQATATTSLMDPKKKEHHVHVLQLAAKQILTDVSVLSQNNNDVYSYNNRNTKIVKVLLVYMLRPNLQAREKIAKTIQEVLPPQQNMDPKTTLGMAIRGSDKCNAESTCLPFARYMELANESGIENMHLMPPKRKGHLIMTTEDRTLFEQRHLYGSTNNNNNNNNTFPFEFVVHEKDTFQGTGRANLFDTIADDVIMGSMVALQMQLHAGHVIANCCSNFHNVIFDFIEVGCGVRQQTTMCMQETTNPKYRICCKTERGLGICKDIWKGFDQEKKNDKKSYLGLIKPYQ